jgi:hypothetical protein
VVNWLGELDYGKSTGRFEDRFGDDDTIRKLSRGANNACIVLAKTEQNYFSTLLNPKQRRTVIEHGPWILEILGSG